MLGNRLSGAIPLNLFAGMSALTTIRIGQNSFNESLSLQLSTTSLNFIDASSNSFTGSYPSVLSLQTSLSYMYVTIYLTRLESSPTISLLEI